MKLVLEFLKYIRRIKEEELLKLQSLISAEVERRMGQDTKNKVKQ